MSFCGTVFWPSTPSSCSILSSQICLMTVGVGRSLNAPDRLSTSRRSAVLRCHRVYEVAKIPTSYAKESAFTAHVGAIVVLACVCFRSRQLAARRCRTIARYALGSAAVRMDDERYCAGVEARETRWWARRGGAIARRSRLRGLFRGAQRVLRGDMRARCFHGRRFLRGARVAQ